MKLFSQLNGERACPQDVAEQAAVTCLRSPTISGAKIRSRNGIGAACSSPVPSFPRPPSTPVGRTWLLRPTVQQPSHAIPPICSPQCRPNPASGGLSRLQRTQQDGPSLGQRPGAESSAAEAAPRARGGSLPTAFRSSEASCTRIDLSKCCSFLDSVGR